MVYAHIAGFPITDNPFLSAFMNSKVHKVTLTYGQPVMYKDRVLLIKQSQNIYTNLWSQRSI